jgi:hypothetical protein
LKGYCPYQNHHNQGEPKKIIQIKSRKAFSVIPHEIGLLTPKRPGILDQEGDSQSFEKVKVPPTTGRSIKP